MTEETKKALATMYAVKSKEKLERLKMMVYVLTVMLSVSLAINAVFVFGQSRNGGVCTIIEENQEITSPAQLQRNSATSSRQAILQTMRRKLSA